MLKQRLVLPLLWFFFLLAESEQQNDKRQLHNTIAPNPTTADPLLRWMSSTSSSKPNVLFLIADDLRPKLGCYGEDNMVTPNIDSLASKSVMFQRAYAQVAWCAPSRTSFLTGRRADSTRVYDLFTYFRTVAGNFTTLPQFFRDNGYFTQAAGKVFHGGVAGDNDKTYSWSEDVYFGNFSHRERQVPALKPVNSSEVGILHDEDIANFAVDFLRDHSQQRDQPFFLAVGFRKPHLPFEFPQQYLDLYPLSNIHLAAHRTRPAGLPDVAWSNMNGLRHYPDVAARLTEPDSIISDDFQMKLRRGYSAATSFMDAQLGRVLKALDQYGFAQNTIVSFLGDHGWHLGDNAEWGKVTNFEMALRIPMMLYVPGVTSHNLSFDFIDALSSDFNPPTINTTSNHSSSSSIPPDHRTRELVEALDLYPTLIELAGLPKPLTCPEDNLHVPMCTEGTSLVPLVQQVRGLPSTHPAMQWKQAAFSQFLRNINDSHHSMGYTVRTDTLRYTEWVDYDLDTYRANFDVVIGRELYNHTDDPYEFRNLAEVMSSDAEVQRMSQLLRDGWRKTMADYLDTLH